MRCSVVIASKNRPDLLRRALDVIVPQVSAVNGEIIVVDDGSEPAYGSRDFPDVTLLRTNGVGPARARNRGARVAKGDIIAFTDDDVVVDDAWLFAALQHLLDHPDHAGVVGDTSSPPVRALYEHSVEDHVGGNFLTCNVVYRREALWAVGGFDLLWSHAHEDRDLGLRVCDTVGPVVFEPAMKATHPGRPFTISSYIRRASFILDDWLLFARYPDRRVSRRSVRFTPVWNTARTWLDVARREHPWRNFRDGTRWLALAGGQTLLSAWYAVTKWRDLRDRDITPVPGLTHDRWRIAYVGPSPHPAAGGAPGVAGLLLAELLDRGHSVECFVAASREDDDPRGLGERPGLSYVIGRSGFAFGRWYSRTRLTKMMSLQIFAGVNRWRLSRQLALRHEASPYDVVYQFSTFESVGVPRRRKNMPVVIHPSVHAAGERYWTKTEASLGLSSDSALRLFLVGLWLGLRARRQRHDAQRATAIFALSRAFGALISEDYAVPSEKIHVVPNCIAVDELEVATPASFDLMVVGRLAVRKGLEDVVALSHELGALDPRVRLRVIGSPSLWSDYQRALDRADSRTLVREGARSRHEVFAEVGGSLALLQLSRYEPFGLTVAESLALGVPVIVTPAVGAAEDVAADVCVRVEPGDIGGLREAVLTLCSLREDERMLLAYRCRKEAERLFRPSVVADQLEAAFAAVLTGVRES